MLDDRVYHKVSYKGFRDFEYTQLVKDEEFDRSTSLYIRQEGRAIYSWNSDISLNPDIKRDNLMIDYDLKIGDEIKSQSSHCWNESDTIKKIDSIMVSGEYRRRLYLDNSEKPFLLKV